MALDVVKQVYERLGEGDIPGFLGLCAEDIEWVVNGPAALEKCRTFQGIDGVREFLAILDRTWAFTAFAPREFIAGGDKVVVLGEEAGSDGTAVAFVVGQQLKTVSLAGGTPITLVGDAVTAWAGLAWLEDGTIAYTSGEVPPTALWRVPAAGGTPTLVSRPDSGGSIYPQALPGARGLLFAWCFARVCDGYVYDLRRDAAHVVVPGAQHVAYAATGYLLYTLQGALMAAPFDLDRLMVRGAAVPLADHVRDFSLSSNGTLILQTADSAGTGPRFKMVWVDRGGRETAVDTTFTARLTASGGNTGWALSPDGTRLAIGLHGDEGDDIWVKHLPRGSASRVTTDPAPDWRPRWTRDGRSITFMSERQASIGVFVRRADGTGSDSLLFAARQAGVLEAALTPDGQRLLMRIIDPIETGRGRDIVSVRLGRDTVPVPMLATRFDEEAIALSPDGTRIAYQSDETGTTEIFLRPFPDVDAGRWQVSSGGGVAPLWSRDGGELFYLSANHDMMSVRVARGAVPTPATPVKLFHVADALLQVETDYYTPWDVAPDGRFIMARALDSGEAPTSSIVVVENFLEELKAKVGR